MPLRNRVRPDGALVALSERGTLMGNRGGRIHDPATRTLGGRRWASRAWIACELEFRGRREAVWGAGYTQLFFLDEVTALAAGHRPCFECRRADATAFLRAVERATGTVGLRAPDLDRRLHDERLDGRAKRTHVRDASALPDGAVVERDGGFHAVRDGELLAWSPAGWRGGGPLVSGRHRVLTPPTALAALRAGYAPRWRLAPGA